MKKIIRRKAFETNSSSCHSLTLHKSYDLLEQKANKFNVKKELKKIVNENNVVVINPCYANDSYAIYNNVIDKLTIIISDQLTNLNEICFLSLINLNSEFFKYYPIELQNIFRKIVEVEDYFKRNQHQINDNKKQQLINEINDLLLNYVYNIENIKKIIKWIKEETNIDLQIKFNVNFKNGIDFKLFGTDHESQYFTSELLKDKETFINFLGNGKSNILLRFN